MTFTSISGTMQDTMTRGIKIVALVVWVLISIGIIAGLVKATHKTSAAHKTTVANVQPTKKPTYVKVIDFSGTNTDRTDLSSNAASNYFVLQTGHIKVDYSVTGSEDYPVLTGYVRGENQNIAFDHPYYFYNKGHRGETSTTLKPGKYNIVMDCPAETCTVAVYEAQ